MTDQTTPCTALSRPEYIPHIDAVRYHCPLACGWTYDRHADDSRIRTVLDGTPDPVGRAVNESIQRRLANVEDTIAAHLAGHGPHDWMPVLAQLTELAHATIHALRYDSPADAETARRRLDDITHGRDLRPYPEDPHVRAKLMAADSIRKMTEQQ